MKNKLGKAISNNNGLYEEIFGSQNIKSQKTDSIWYALEKTPPFYSNLVTLSKDWNPDEIFKTIDLNYEKEKWEEWSIKDSFAVLDLNSYGFEKLFNAQWIYLESSKFIPLVNTKKLRYEIVKNEEVLSAWRIAWDSNEKIGKEIFNSKLLDNPKVHFIAGYDEHQIVSGCFVNKTDDVLGISNFFAPNDDIQYWSGIVSFIFDSIERSDILGYEQNELSAKLQVLGFEKIGNLAVWLKKRDT